MGVPTHFYKVILCQHTTGTVELFAFLLENGLNPRGLGVRSPMDTL